MSEAPTAYTHVWEDDTDDFASLDAALWEWCAVTYGTGTANARRIPRASASIRYRIAQGEAEAFSLVLRQLKPGRFLMEVYCSPGFAEELHRVGAQPDVIIGTFLQWRKQDAEQPVKPEIATGSTLPTVHGVPSPRRGGRSSYPEDIRAREQIAAGIDREMVFQEWSKHFSRKRKRPSNLRDTFRKVVIEKTKPE